MGKKYFKETPLVSIHGFLQKIQNDENPDYRAILCDILGNNSYGKLVKLAVIFTEIIPGIFKFERIELNSTGIGMAPETQVDDYYGIPNEGDENKFDPKSETGYYTLGETVGFSRLTTTELSKDSGFKSCTKRSQDDLYSYANRDLLGDKWITEPEQMDYGEAFSMDIPVDKMGDSGTYSCYDIDLSRWENGAKWFPKFKEYTENIFMNWLEDKYELTFTLKTLDGNVKKEVLKGKKFCVEGDEWIDTTLNIEGKAFDVKIGRRSKDKSDEQIEFDTKYPNRRALKSNGLISSIARHPVIILMDKKNGYIYSIIPHTGSLDRLITIIYVDKEDIIPETNKSGALIKNPKTEKGLNQHLLTQKVNKITKQFYNPITEASEDELLSQLDDVLKGKKDFHVTFLDQLYEDLNDDIYEELNEDHDKLKSFYIDNLEYESNQDGNEVDMVVSIADWLIEGKPKPPETDDFDQIVKYIALREDIKRMTIVGVSDPNDKNGQKFTKKNHLGFPKAMISRFTTELKAKLSHHEQLKNLKINLIDLRYYGLHKLI